MVWAPDSKRFALNYSPPHIPHTTYVMTVFYELRSEKWVPLASPIDPSAPNPLAQRAKRLPKAAHSSRHWNSDPRFVLKVRRWKDDHTAELYLYSAAEGPRSASSVAAFVFTLKFLANGKWEVVGPRQLSRKEIETEKAAGP